MVFETAAHRAEREARDFQLYPELQLGEYDDIFSVDRLRREQGEQPTSLGLQTESVWLHTYGDDYDAPRDLPREEPFLPAPPPEPEPWQHSYDDQYDPPTASTWQHEYQDQYEPPPLWTTYQERPMVQSGGNQLLSDIGGIADPVLHELSRFPAMFRGIIENPTDLGAGAEAFLNPESVPSYSSMLQPTLGDQSLWGKAPGILPDDISGADIIGGLGDLFFDPLNSIGAGPARRAIGAIPESSFGRGLTSFVDDEAAALRLPEIRPNASDVAPFPAPEAGRALFGLEDITPGLTGTQRLKSAASDFTGMGVPDDELATPAMALRAKVEPRIRAQAAALSAELDSVVRREFRPDSLGRIHSLEGAPTIQDVAARRAHYYPLLTSGQKQALAQLEVRLAPVRQFLDEVGIGDTLGTRADVEPGGFYLPRGNALKEGIDAPFKVRAGRGAGKSSFQREAVFDSMAGGIEEGFRYSPFGDALRGYVQAAGRRGTDEHVANYLKQFGRPIPEGGIGRAEGAIGTPLPTQGWEFPDALTNAVNKVLRNEGDLMGAGSQVPRALNAANALFRGLQATGELSQLGIQGAVGMVTDPVGYGRAMKASLEATFGRDGADVLGKFINDFNQRAAAGRRLSASEWAGHGLQIGGPETEFQVGRGLGGKIGEAIRNAPLAKQTNRGFGYFGDAQRLEIADTMYEEALRKGKVLTDAEIDSIAKTADRITGWSPRRSFGSLGEMLQFAPRFFQARLESIAQLASTNVYERQLARRSLGRWVGTGITLTWLANEALGNEYDYWSPVKDGRINSNFMRVRGLGRDWSFFGTYDSLLRIALNGVTGDTKSALRSVVNSPVASTLWDLIEGESYVGTPTRQKGEGLLGLLSPETAKYLASRTAPFALPTGSQAVGELAAGKLPEAIGSAAQAVVGLRGTPISPSERLDEVTPSGSFFDPAKTTRAEQEEIKAKYPELWEAYVKGATERTQRREEITAKALADQQAVDELWLSNQLDMDTWKAANDRLTIDSRARKDEIYRLAADSPHDVPIVEEYFRTLEAAEKPWGVDWRQFHKWENGLTAEQQATIAEYVGVGGTPFQKERRAASSELEKAGFFKIRDDAWEGIRKGDPELAQYEAPDAYRIAKFGEFMAEAQAAGYDRGQALALWPTVADKLKPLVEWSKISNAFEETWIRSHPALAARAIEFGYLRPDFLRKAERETIAPPR